MWTYSRCNALFCLEVVLVLPSKWEMIVVVMIRYPGISNPSVAPFSTVVPKTQRKHLTTPLLPSH